MLVLVHVATASASVTVQLTRVDGGMVTGEWRGLGAAADKSIELMAKKDMISTPLADVMTIEFNNEPRDSSSAPALVHLADGGALRALILDRAADAVLADTILENRATFPFDRLAAIEFNTAMASTRGTELFEEALQNRLPAQDILIALGDEPKAIRGRVESVVGEKSVDGEDDGRPRGRFRVADRSHPFLHEKAHGIVFASGAAKPIAYPMTVTLIDGSRVSGWLESADVASIRMRTSYGSTPSVPVDRLSLIELRSDQVVYLSDLSPIDEKLESVLSRPWPWRKDRSVAGGPIAISGRVYPKGLGVRSSTHLVYPLNGEYEQFVSTIGLDDHVRPRGSVVYRVIADGNVVFDSGRLTGSDEPRDVVVDVGGVKQLTLAVDYGDHLDLADHADWAGARLIRAKRPGAKAKAVTN